tara:strand:+ start:135 stop:542 length:408 start_codon:yes stop_codon:yes gene_type:complete
MSVKLAVLKSGEDIVADIKEARDKKTQEPIWYVFKNPIQVALVDVRDPEKKLLMEEREDQGKRKELFFSPWLPLSADNEVIVPMDWVVTVVNPHEQVLQSYTERVGIDGDITEAEPKTIPDPPETPEPPIEPEVV